MLGIRFNHGWTYGRRSSAFSRNRKEIFVLVDLPHDAMLAAGRDPAGDPSIAYFRSDAYQYEKCFDAPDSWRDKTVVLRFEGVYRDTTVLLNNESIAQWPFGYSEVAVRLDDHLEYGAENVLQVECRSGQDSRWYSGAGIYRDVTLFVAHPVHVALDGIRVTTPEIADEAATATVDIEVENGSDRRATVDVVTEILDADGAVVGADRQPLTVARTSTAITRARILVPAPKRWSPDAPNLYTCAVRVIAGDDVLDTTTTAFGFRSLTVDAVRGLRINGETVKLRGACIHHDNGVLGAATFAAAEERRVVRLKRAGFNALRMAHHPMSRHLLDACDRHGMLVMDEAFDMWRIAKTEHDYAAHFSTRWRRDVEAMVRKDRNRPSVILYSIGNEIEEIGSTTGAQLGRDMADLMRTLDPTRLVTNGLNMLLAARRSGPLNESLGRAGQDEDVMMLSEHLTKITEESCAVLDVAGYNYAVVRYRTDGERFPNRVIVGSETFPRTIDRSWREVLDCDHVIGDFTWTGWDYLGEVGVGRAVHETEPGSTAFLASYPWRTATCGDIDIAGNRLPISYYREVVFGLRAEPFIAVRPPPLHGLRKLFATKWSWTGAVESWTWEGDEGRSTTVEVYADADDVELVLNGRSAGRQPAGEAHRFMARFEVTYEPGELVAIARRDGVETGRSTLVTASGDLALEMRAPDQVPADGSDIVLVDISLVDRAGTVHPGRDREIVVTVDGPGRLQGLGSSAPASEESFLADRCTTYRGRALAAIRPSGPGTITVHVRADGMDEAAVTITAVDQT